MSLPTRGRCETDALLMAPDGHHHHVGRLRRTHVDHVRALGLAASREWMKFGARPLACFALSILKSSPVFRFTLKRHRFSSWSALFRSSGALAARLDGHHLGLEVGLGTDQAQWGLPTRCGLAPKLEPQCWTSTMAKAFMCTLVLSSK